MRLRRLSWPVEPVEGCAQCAAGGGVYRMSCRSCVVRWIARIPLKAARAKAYQGIEAEHGPEVRKGYAEAVSVFYKADVEARRAAREAAHAARMMSARQALEEGA